MSQIVQTTTQAKSGGRGGRPASFGTSALIAGRGAIFLILIALIVIFTVVQPVFLRAANLLDILEAVSVTALLGLGITVSLAVGGFDLSVGSTAAMGVMTAAYAQVVWGWGAVPTVLLRARRRRHHRAFQQPADHRAARARSPGDARHAVPCRRPATDPERRQFDLHRHDVRGWQQRQWCFLAVFPHARAHAALGAGAAAGRSFWPSSQFCSGY